MYIRKTTTDDLAAVMGIYAEAREFMRNSGNPDQWGDNHPTQAMIERDIQKGASYVCVKDNKIVAAFYFSIEDDPTYAKIDGAWLNDKAYGVVHRMARGKGGTGTGEFCLKWCLAQHPNIRIDTHRDNAPMLNLLERLGFIYCGIIWTRVSEERLAFAQALQSKITEPAI